VTFAVDELSPAFPVPLLIDEGPALGESGGEGGSFLAHAGLVTTFVLLLENVAVFPLIPVLLLEWETCPLALWVNGEEVC